MPPAMKLLFVADPLEVFKPYKDSTYAMMREAAARGHAIHACEPAHLHWQRGAKVMAQVRQLLHPGNDYSRSGCTICAPAAV